ncbi:MAG: DEAD/DEAH box helicase family protein [Vampirovibrionales bacterium]|nr:DEAD/DEAH box helicase family protein [Vampirovibrionales bacterium]
MKLQLDASQRFQLDAIQSVVDLFKGQPLAGSTFEMTSTLGGEFGLKQTEMGLANHLVLSDQGILSNLQEVQARNGLTHSGELLGDRIAEQFIPHFSLEMETGTGKTYVYLRSLLELNKQYGFTKFIIVVPGTPIREGVAASFGLLKEHFAVLYENTPVNFWVYDSKYASRLREFAASNQIQVLLINIEAFRSKDMAILHKERDQTNGHRPVEFIQATRPIVILDEPQNMESEKAKEAVASLNPLCTLRFSATHRNPYNVVYRLGPVKAYDLGLVKRIEVDSVLENPNFNTPFIQVESIENTSKNRIVAKLKIDVETKGSPVRKSITVVHNGFDLAEKSGREQYQGYIVQEINSGEGYIAFSNGITLNVGDTHGGQTDDRMKIQIRETVKEHFDKELAISRLPENQRLKVLSLFFIDRVANYRGETNEPGKLAVWFEEAYQELASKERYSSLNRPPVEQVHDGYFARDKKSGAFKDTKSENDADRDVYALIMKDKTRLLSPEEPLKFIFSHSALREGWDNPNVFQICTLNESHSEIKKRQEIGRGLRLPVRVSGERCFDPQINRLTVIANEAYDDFARKLQEEIEEETGEKFAGRIKNKRDRKPVALKKGWRLNEDFKALWDRISQKTVYSVRYDTQKLIQDAAAAFAKTPKITAPTFSIRKSAIAVTEAGLEATLKTTREEAVNHGGKRIPDMVRYLQSKTELTRGTVAQILIQSGRLQEAMLNPQAFMEQALEAIQGVLRNLMVNGISYEKIAGDFYEMLLFEQEEVESYLDRLIKVEHSIFDYVEYDSETERLFAEQLDRLSDIKLFVKLPNWFKVQTPIGSYNPDWAIAKEADQKLYLVRETKGTDQLSLLRTSEIMKIECGQAHFNELEVDFAVVRTAAEV